MRSLIKASLTATVVSFLMISYFVFFADFPARAAEDYQIKLKSGASFCRDVTVTINNKDYGSGYGGQTLSPISLNDEAPNLISFSVAENAKDLKEEKYVPVLFRVYKNKELYFSILGAYSPESDIGKKISVEISPLIEVEKDRYFFFKGAPAEKVIVVTTGFANGYFFDGETGRSGFPADQIWVSFITDTDLPYIFLMFDDKTREKRGMEPPFYITRPYFCYADVNKGVIYQKEFAGDAFKTIDTVYVKFNPTDYQLSKKIPVKDKQTLAKVKTMIFPTLKEISRRIEALALELKDPTEENEKKSLAILQKTSAYLEKTEPYFAFSGLELIAARFLKSCPQTAKSDPNTIEIKAFKRDSFVIAELYDKTDKTVMGFFPLIYLLFEEKARKIVPVYPF